MSTITSYDDALDFMPKAEPRAPKASLLTTLRAVWEALGEGLTAASRYRQLTARGVPPQKAAAEVFSEHYASR